MANKERLLKERVNFFDGQQVTEDDLDTEQLYFQNISSEIVTDFHGSGVLNLEPFSAVTLLDTRYPGSHCLDDTENSSKLEINSGTYDGKGISLDRQPSDVISGTRIVVTLADVDILGKNKPKILIIGRTFNGIDSNGILNHEFLEFEKNTSLVTKFYYQKIITVLFNNFSGGTGKTELVDSAESLDLITDTGGYAVFTEAEPLKVYAKTIVAEQTLSPSYDLVNFITSSVSNDIETEISLALDSTSSISELYFDLEAQEQMPFTKNGSTAIAYGQKFLAKTDNLQRVDVLLSVAEDTSRSAGEEFDWSGDLVLGIYKISGATRFITSAVPDDLIEFDPDLNPLVEVSFGQDDFEALGYKLTDVPQMVSFNLASTLLADPAMEPVLEKNKFYSFILSRNGDNRIGTLYIEKGYDNVFKKTDSGIELSIKEQFAKQESRFFEYDTAREQYLDEPDSSLWFKIYSNTVEVASGTAYVDGKSVTVPKTQDYVGGNKISYFEDNISLPSLLNDNKNYIVLNAIEKFVDAESHPMTGNFLFKKIQDAAGAFAVDQVGLDNLLEDEVPLILASVIDNNVRDASQLTGEFDKPGLILPNKIIITNPSDALLSANLIGRVITPDLGNTSNQYRIARTACQTILLGDLDKNGLHTLADLSLFLNVVGNTINSVTTERAILSGDLLITDFIQSDLNDDATVDGLDIELLEDAIDGYVNFGATLEVKILELYLENALSEDNYPSLFIDIEETGITTAATDEIIFTTLTNNQALAIRAGDIVEIPSGVDDSGIYTVVTKTIGTDLKTVTLTVTDSLGDAVVFEGSSDFNVTVSSGTAVNTYADNYSLLNLPFIAKEYTIDFVDFPFREMFLDICDLRRFVESSFIEEEVQIAETAEDACSDAATCAPVYKNQYYFPGDIYIPNGQIYTEPGILYPGDYEYANILMPLPPGTITGCSVNLYETFVKLGADSVSKTAAGFDAMKYSDGTYVGVNDSGSLTDLFYNRVKFSHAIASLYVDGLVDGYAVDGYADAESSTTNGDVIIEEFTDYSYTQFDAWLEDGFNDSTFGTVTHVSGANESASFDVTTIASAGTKYIRLNGPSDITDFEDDFIVDFTAIRMAWPQSSLTSGTVSAFATFEIENDDGSSSTLKLGWRGVGGSTAKIFYSGEIRDVSDVIVDSFDSLVDAPDSVGEELLFRLRRTSDAFFAYYIVPDSIGDSEEEFGDYIRIGENPTTQPGAGTVNMSFEVNQINTPNSGENFLVNLSEVVIRSEYTSDDEADPILIGRNDSTNIINRLTVNFPINISVQTNLVSATLKMTSKTSGNVLDTFNIIPLENINARNLTILSNIPQTQDSATIVSFIPGDITVDEVIEVDVSAIALAVLANPSHLPGFYKALIIEPASDADGSFEIDPALTLLITYEDISTGVVFQVGVSVNPLTGIATFNTKNILYDANIEENRTVIEVGVHLKKSGFINADKAITIEDLSRIGIGSCENVDVLSEDDTCYFIAGSTAVGTFVGGSFPCQFHLP